MKIQEFIDELSVRSKSAETLRAYRQDLERFDVFLKLQGLRINQVKRSTIVAYTKYLEETHKQFEDARDRIGAAPLSPATINRRLTVLSEYFIWAQGDSDKRVANPVALIKRPKVQNEDPSPVDEEDLQKLCDGITDPRDKAIFLVFVYSGLRLFELVKLNVGSIRPRRRKSSSGISEFYGFGTVIGKGGKKRNFIVGPVALKALQTYVASRKLSDLSCPLFASDRGQRLGCRAIQKILARWCCEVGINHVRVHQLRHTFATRNVNAGMSMEVLKELLGHSKLTATQRYFKVRPERIQREYYAATEFPTEPHTVNEISQPDLALGPYLVKRRPAA
jgi:site-specific recombinase XerD